jgi:hypothetical protein
VGGNTAAFDLAAAAAFAGAAAVLVVRLWPRRAG